MAETKGRRKIEIDPAAMPEGYPCAKCEQTCNETCNGRPCIKFKIFYAEFMHRCRVATGCCGCAISARAVEDLEKIRPYEPNVVKAAWSIFGDSYRYRAAYNEYKAKRMGRKD